MFSPSMLPIFPGYHSNPCIAEIIWFIEPCWICFPKILEHELSISIVCSFQCKCFEIPFLYPYFQTWFSNRIFENFGMLALPKKLLRMSSTISSTSHFASWTRSSCQRKRVQLGPGLRGGRHRASPGVLAGEGDTAIKTVIKLLRSFFKIQIETFWR